ncbi:MAG: hypothetical protein KA267_11005 [Gemmatimonadales bacterium]|nr:hypothetical protein [Gemmatimonadales bacterium]MBP6572010.1 hypothetical protein [Gemmatimonadales bacterium]MBP7620581.1 hypothetical protein [Gemmatimonadales bacterium]
MKYLLALACTFAPASLAAQATPSRVPEPHALAIDSKDNVYVAIKYGIVRIAPDGTLTNLTKVAGTNAEMDRAWGELLVDSKDNLYANDGKLIYKFAMGPGDKLVGTIFAGQQWSYKEEDGPLATAGFNQISQMAIDTHDNIYLTDSYDKIKDAVGSNFVTDSFYLNDPAKKYVKYPSRRYSVIRKISADGIVSTLKTPDGKFVLPNEVSGLAVDGAGNLVYSTNGFGRFIGKIDVASGVLSRVAGQPYKREWCPVYTPGAIGVAEFVSPMQLTVSTAGAIVVTDNRMNRVIKIAAGTVSTLAGNSVIDPCAQNIGGRSQEGYRDGTALVALFNMPAGLAYDSKGNLYVGDSGNHAIRKVTPAGIVSTFAR